MVDLQSVSTNEENVRENRYIQADRWYESHKLVRRPSCVAIGEPESRAQRRQDHKVLLEPSFCSYPLVQMAVGIAFSL
jgi:hypothetical protein